MLSLKLSLMSSKDRVVLNFSTVVLFIVWHTVWLTVWWHSVKEGYKGCHNTPRKLEIKSRKSVSQRCYIVSPWNHGEVLRSS